VPTIDFSKNVDVKTDAKAQVEKAAKTTLYAQSRLATNTGTLRIKIFNEFTNKVAKTSANCQPLRVH
jgi:hypothetical protein